MLQKILFRSINVLTSTITPRTAAKELNQLENGIL